MSAPRPEGRRRRRPGRARGGRGDRTSPRSERRNPLPGGNEAFTCARCGARVSPLENGSVRNHCPECLWSLHVDRVPGDRAESCGGLMEPVALEGSAAAGFSIVFRCEACGAARRNRAAEDDPVQPDRWEVLIALSSRAPSAGRRRRGKS